MNWQVSRKELRDGFFLEATTPAPAMQVSRKELRGAPGWFVRVWNPDLEASIQEGIESVLIYDDAGLTSTSIQEGIESLCTGHDPAGRTPASIQEGIESIF